MRVLVIIPTYNEADNIIRLINAVLSLKLEIDVLVVDDRSTKYYIDDKVVKLWLTYHTRDSYRADDTDLILFREFQGLKLWALPDKDFIKR